MADDEKRLKGFRINNTHVSLIPKIMRDVKVGDLVGIVLNNAGKDDTEFRGDFYSGFVHMIAYDPDEKDQFMIALRRGHPLNKSSLLGDGEDIENSIINARHISHYKIYESFDKLNKIIN